MADADKHFFNKIITGDETDVLPMTAKQSDRVQVQHQDHVDNYFQFSRPSSKRINTSGGENSKCIIL
jgi:hypothetical protein